MLRTLCKRAARPAAVVAVKTRGGTTVMRDLAFVRARIRRSPAGPGKARFSDMALNPFPAMAGAAGSTAIVEQRKAVEKSRSWLHEVVQGPWHEFTPKGLAVVSTCGNLCALAAAAAHDHMTMRFFSVCATGAVAAFNFLMPKPLKTHQWTAGGWGTIFCTLHMVNLGILLYANSGGSFTKEEEEIYKNGFHRFGVTPHQFQQLTRAGAEYMDIAPGVMVVGAGTPVDKVFYVVRGSVEARHPGTDTLRIEYHDDVFIGCLEPKVWQAEHGHNTVGHETPQDEVLTFHHSKSRRDLRAILTYGLEERTGPRTKLVSGTSWQNNNIAGPQGCRVLYWPLSTFADIVGKDEKLVHAMERADEMGLACKICWGASHTAIEGYKELLDSVGSEGRIKPQDKRTLTRYRARFAIREEEHLSSLEELGWTPKDFEDGYKKNMWRSSQ